MINKEFINDKKVILYGDRKETRDFLYIYDWIYYSFIISPEGRIDEKNNIFDLEKLKTEEKDKLLVIICWRNHEQAISDMEQCDLVHKKHYIIADEIFYLLDSVDMSQIASKYIYIWGTGETQRDLERCLEKNEYYVDIKGYIDSDNGKWNKTLNEMPILSPDKFFEIDNTYVIVASIYFDEIKQQLEEHNRKVGEDFECFTKFINRPSKMMKKTMYDLPIKALSPCSVPFEEFRCTCYGIIPCCVSMIEYPVGSIYAETLEENWNSIVMKLYRLSVENRTFSFCKKGVCGLLPQNPEFLNEDEVVKHSYRVQTNDFPAIFILGLDNSCNLHCQTCRKETYFAKGSLLEKRKQAANKVVASGWLEKSDEVFLSVDGEVFASEVDKIILANYKRGKKLHIISNGTLFTEEKWKLVEGKADVINVNISVDAASEATYSEIRRGGNWKQLQKNLQMLSKKRLEKKIDYIDIRMVVQEKNYREMKEFIKMAEKFHFDKVVFTRLNNYGTYGEDEYRRISLFDKKGLCLAPELTKELQDEIYKKEIVDISSFGLYMQE